MLRFNALFYCCCLDLTAAYIGAENQVGKQHSFLNIPITGITYDTVCESALT